ncbi:hypothetical protein VUR80DRAFT_5001 [Thermomyces stellatus]
MKICWGGNEAVPLYRCCGWAGAPNEGRQELLVLTSPPSDGPLGAWVCTETSSACTLQTKPPGLLLCSDVVGVTTRQLLSARALCLIHVLKYLNRSGSEAPGPPGAPGAGPRGERKGITRQGVPGHGADTSGPIYCRQDAMEPNGAQQTSLESPFIRGWHHRPPRRGGRAGPDGSRLGRSKGIPHLRAQKLLAS